VSCAKTAEPIEMLDRLVWVHEETYSSFGSCIAVDAVVRHSSSTGCNVTCIALDCDTNHEQVVIQELFTDINNVLVVIKDHHATPS